MPSVSRYLGIALLLISTHALLTACSAEENLGNAEPSSTYLNDVEAFFSNRTERLKEPLGWMRLAGMYWLEEGSQTFGSSERADIVFPAGYIPEMAGRFNFDGETVRMEVDRGITITVDGKAVQEAVLHDDTHSDVFAVYETLHWTVIKRGDLTGIRLYNTQSERIDQFQGFDRFPVDEQYYVNARMVLHEEPTTIPVVNVLGQTSEVRSPGRLHFHLHGRPYSLIALEGGERMFVIVGDETNRTDTFQGGRYIYIDYSEEGSDITRIDFNLLYNPPCAFNPYTTCQFPPRENILPIRVEAGELRPIEPFRAMDN